MAQKDYRQYGYISNRQASNSLAPDGSRYSPENPYAKQMLYAYGKDDLTDLQTAANNWEAENAAYNRQLEDQLRLRDEDRAYNSPAAQASRFRDAGINPEFSPSGSSSLGSSPSSHATAPAINNPAQGQSALDTLTSAEKRASIANSYIGASSQILDMANSSMDLFTKSAQYPYNQAILQNQAIASEQLPLQAQAQTEQLQQSNSLGKERLRSLQKDNLQKDLLHSQMLEASSAGFANSLSPTHAITPFDEDSLQKEIESSPYNGKISPESVMRYLNNPQLMSDTLSAYDDYETNKALHSSRGSMQYYETYAQTQTMIDLIQQDSALLLAEFDKKFQSRLNELGVPELQASSDALTLTLSNEQNQSLLDNDVPKLNAEEQSARLQLATQVAKELSQEFADQLTATDEAISQLDSWISNIENFEGNPQKKHLSIQDRATIAALKSQRMKLKNLRASNFAAAATAFGEASQRYSLYKSTRSSQSVWNSETGTFDTYDTSDSSFGTTNKTLNNSYKYHSLLYGDNSGSDNSASNIAATLLGFFVRKF
ncbi:DNA pilot protein [Sigmofec virus UA08Rod_3978]|uniref:DNA pilot protein n=1 Tax=Sigmofec virus UA08Rod_3978 TaxID=2929392 RepID=A0A976N2L9_9VIRU|nr:DNA pilot protein [Sigmofec virus UA08Rod_3978]